MSETDILIAIQEAVRKALCEAANAEIEKLRHKFECEMGKVKSEMVGKLVNQIEIATRHEPFTDRVVIQINLKGGR